MALFSNIIQGRLLSFSIYKKRQNFATRNFNNKEITAENVNDDDECLRLLKRKIHFLPHNLDQMLLDQLQVTPLPLFTGISEWQRAPMRFKWGGLKRIDRQKI